MGQRMLSYPAALLRGEANHGRGLVASSPFPYHCETLLYLDATRKGSESPPAVAKNCQHSRPHFDPLRGALPEEPLGSG